MVYASYSTATKGGGVNAGNNPTPYEKEETSVIDFGLKAKFLDGAMLLNMNVFKNENNGMLLDTIRDTQSFNINVDAEITGFEIEYEQIFEAIMDSSNDLIVKFNYTDTESGMRY